VAPRAWRFAGGAQRVDFGVGLAGALVPAFADDVPSRTSTQPTRGFGVVVLEPARGQPQARAMAAWSVVRHQAHGRGPGFSALAARGVGW
jgi:hypothetical protein